MIRQVRRAVLLAATGTLAACGVIGPECNIEASLDINPAYIELSVGQTLSPEWIRWGRDCDGEMLSATQLQWTPEDSAVVGLTQEERLPVAVGVGSTRVLAEYLESGRTLGSMFVQVDVR